MCTERLLVLPYLRLIPERNGGIPLAPNQAKTALPENPPFVYIRLRTIEEKAALIRLEPQARNMIQRRTDRC